MKTFIFHGQLADELGSAKWSLDVQTLAEGFRALEIITGKLKTALKRRLNQGLEMCIVINRAGLLTTEKAFQQILDDDAEVHCECVVAGSGPIALLVVGAVLTVAGASIPATVIAASITSLMVTIGVSLMLSGIMGLISPSPTFDASSESKERPSTSFDGAHNTSHQGLPVPVGYGRLIVGSACVSASLIAADAVVSADGIITPPVPTW